MTTQISFTAARLDDAAGMADFLAAIPNGDDLRKVLQNGKAVSSRAYDDETWTARFVASDGSVVKCFTVSAITIDQAEMIAAACLDTFAWDVGAFGAAVAEALGPTLDSID
jgi:hypothetical protein